MWRTHAGEEPAPGLGELFGAAHFVTLLNLDLAKDPDAHFQEAARRASDLMELAQAQGGYLLVGVPAIPLQVTRPDLVVSRLGIPASGQVGGNLSLSVSLKNQGDAPAKKSKVQLYLSGDPQLGGGDRLLGKKGVKALLVGEEAVLALSLTLPKDLAPGTYYLGAVADAKG